jgi:hypothetical protein
MDLLPIKKIYENYFRRSGEPARGHELRHCGWYDSGKVYLNIKKNIRFQAFFKMFEKLLQMPNRQSQLTTSINI